MKNYLVKALAVSGKGRNIYTNGETISEDKFVEGTAEEYVKTKHLEVVTEKKAKAKSKAKKATDKEKLDTETTAKATEETTAIAEETSSESTDSAKKAK